MLMVASAEEVASMVPSGENFKLVIPRAWALGKVWRGLKRRVLCFCAVLGAPGFVRTASSFVD